MLIKFSPDQILPTFKHTVTILNKLRNTDSVTKQDVWYKTTVQMCSWSEYAESSMNGDTVSIGGHFVVRIPKQENYLPYSEWKKNPDGHLTFSVGDIIIKGEIEEDIITANTIPTIFQKYRPEAFYVKVFQDNTNTIPLAEHYRVEGA